MHRRVAALILLARAATAAPTATLAGTVEEKGTRHPLGGATVTVQPAAGEPFAVECDERGRFSIEAPPGALQVAASAADHVTATFAERLAPGERLEVVYHLDPKPARYQTVVRGARAREEVARTTLAIEEVQKIPGTHGDALRAITNLPGVARAPFDTGQLVIWGSAPGESSILVAGHSIPQAFHFGLGTSVFNANLLERIDYLPGNFSVRYGRAIGGVVEIVPRAGAREFHGYASLDFVDASLALEGPLGKGSFAIAARRSVIDGVLAAAGSYVDLGFTQAPVYYDYQAILDQPLWGGKLKAMVFGSDDSLKLLLKSAPDSDPALKGQVSTRVWFHALTLGYTRKWGRFELELSASAGPQHTTFSLGNTIGYALDVVEIDARIEARYQVSRRFTIVGGIDLASDWYQTTVDAPYVAPEGQTQPPVAVLGNRHITEGAWEWSPAAYLEGRLKLGRLTLTPGVRADWYSGQGATIDPRISARLEIAPRTFLLAGAGQFHQVSPSPFSDPMLGNPTLPPEQAWHFSAGVESRPVARLPSLSVRLLGFFKLESNLAATSDAWVQRDGKVVPELYDAGGIGRIYGLELLVRQELSRWVWGWLSYTLSKSERRDHPGDPWRPFQFDQTHILALVVSAHLPWRIDLGARLRYVTGNPETPYRGAIYFADQDVFVPVQGAPFSTRQPDFVQLDLRVDKKFLFNAWWIDVYVDVTNVTDRKNVDGNAYSFDYSRSAPVTGIPIFPSLGLKAAF